MTYCFIDSIPMNKTRTSFNQISSILQSLKNLRIAEKPILRLYSENRSFKKKWLWDRCKVLIFFNGVCNFDATNLI